MFAGTQHGTRVLATEEDGFDELSLPAGQSLQLHVCCKAVHLAFVQLTLLAVSRTDWDTSMLQQKSRTAEKKVCSALSHLRLPAASGIRKRHRAAQDRHPFSRFFYPVDPHNAAEVSMFMSLYTEHKPKHLRGFQSMAAHWNSIKWAQRRNHVYHAIAYKDAVQLRNFHMTLSAEIGRIESLKLAGLLQDPQPPSPPSSPDNPQPLAALADPSTSAQPSLHASLGSEVLGQAGCSSQLPETGQTGVDCSTSSMPATQLSSVHQKRPAAKQSALAFSAVPQQKSPNPKPLKKAKTSGADQGGKGQKCRACFAYDWYHATLAQPGHAFVDMASVKPLLIKGHPGHRSKCPHREAFETVMGLHRPKGTHSSFPGWGSTLQKYSVRTRMAQNQRVTDFYLCWQHQCFVSLLLVCFLLMLTFMGGATGSARRWSAILHM